MNDHYQRVAEAFSYKALQYDLFGADNPNLTRMRSRVYTHVERFLHPGDRILELNAGTGTDAIHFTSLGYSVHAIDISPGMIAALADKVSRYGLQDQLTFENCSFTDLGQVKNGPFQYVYSNFGGLNCTGQLSEIVDQVPRVLIPGGRMTWVIMPPFCPWDMAMIFQGKFRQAFRRLSRHGVLANVEGVHFQVNYFTPRQVMQVLGKNFRLLCLEGLSVFAPPADRKNFAVHYPRLYSLLTRLDDALTPHSPFNSWGDFFILTVEYDPC